MSTGCMIDQNERAKVADFIGVGVVCKHLPGKQNWRKSEHGNLPEKVPFCHLLDKELLWKKILFKFLFALVYAALLKIKLLN